MNNSAPNQPSTATAPGKPALSDEAIIAIVGLFLAILVPLLGFLFRSLLTQSFGKRRPFLPNSVGDAQIGWSIFFFFFFFFFTFCDYRLSRSNVTRTRHHVA
ncbi:hypothetical protein IWX91DRAFT_330096 [Phyllosticta citricarpa]